MEWTLTDFFAQGGTTSFMDRLASSLGIHASTIKIVSVYEGSLVVDYSIVEPNDDPVRLQQLAAAQIAAYATNQVSLGAPILDVSVTATSATGSAAAPNSAVVHVVTAGTVSAPGYSPIVITKTISNDATLAAQATTTATTTSSTTSTSASASTDRVGSAAYGIVEAGSTVFQPNVSVVVKDPNGSTQNKASGVSDSTATAADKEKEKLKIMQKADDELDAVEDQYEAMTAVDEGASSGAFIVIASVVVVGLIAAMLFTRFMLNQTRARMMEEATTRHAKIAEIAEGQQGEPAGELAKKIKKQDDVLGSRASNADDKPLATKAGSGIELEEYQEQYNANADFAIFQVGDKAVGGHMGLAEKLNMADSIADKSLDTQSVQTQKSSASDLPEQLAESRKQREAAADATQAASGANPSLPPLEPRRPQALAGNQLPEDQEIESLEQL